MSADFSAALAAGSSASSERGCACSGTANPTRSASAFSPLAGLASPAIQTCPNCGGPMLRPSMSSAAAFPAKTSAWPVAEKESGEHARVFGPRCSGSLASFDPATSSWRTCQLSLFEDSMSSSLTWPRSGSMRSGTVYEHATSVPRTSANDSGLWPTPVARDDGKTPEAHMAMKQRMKGGPRNTITSLTVMVKAVERQMWPTPRATDADRGGRGDLIQAVRGNSNPHFRRWPTPTASRRSGLQSHGRNAILGPLNPTWLEWLMGFPMDWTAVAPLETPSSRKSPNGSGDESSTTKAWPRTPTESPSSVDADQQSARVAPSDQSHADNAP